MATATTLAKNIDKIFTKEIDIAETYSSISGTDSKEIDAFDTKNIGKGNEFMLNLHTDNRLAFMARIKSKNERNWLTNKIGIHFDKYQEQVIEALKPYLSDPEGEYDWKFEEKQISGLMSSGPCYIIGPAPKGKKKLEFEIAFAAKGITAGGKKPDPHELMTACLILRQQHVDFAAINRGKDSYNKFKEIVDDLYGMAVKVVGRAGMNGFYMDPKGRTEPDLVNLAKAVSVSNYIVEKLEGTKVKQVWQTGTAWAKEIKKYDVSKDDIKHYNSSDIIVKFEASGSMHYWGISLKKANMSKDEPTLLNKPMYGAKGFIQKRIPPTEWKKVEAAKKEFFTGAMKIKHGDQYNGKDIDKMNIKDILKGANKSFSGNEKADMLMNRKDYKGNVNIYFKTMEKVFMDNFDGERKFFEDFLDTIFKIKLGTYLKDVVFHFSLITGYGDYKPAKGGMLVDKPKEQWHKTTTEVFNYMFGDEDNTTFRLVPGINKQGKAQPQAYQEGASAAKLFFEMKIGKPNKEHSIVMLEVRYKGALTAEPQFQVFMSMKQNGFKDVYDKMATKMAKGPRW